jgi:hypothetical protein
VLELSLVRPGYLAHARSGQKYKAERQPNMSGHRRLQDTVPEKREFFVRQNTATNVLQPTLTKAKARIGRDQVRVGRETENRANERLDTVGVRWCSSSNHLFAERNHVAALNFVVSSISPMRQNMEPEIALVGSCRPLEAPRVLFEEPVS